MISSMGDPDPDQTPTEEKYKALIRELGKEASAREKEGDTEEVRARRCVAVNSQVIARLIKEHGIPGVVYVLEPDRQDSGAQDRFRDQSWWRHAVGVTKLGENKYMVFDETNSQDPEGGDFFVAVGTLEELSGELEERFGSRFWELEWGGDPAKSIKGKIEMIETKLKEGKREVPSKAYTVRFNPPPGFTPESARWDSLRKSFTFDTT